MSLPFNKSFGCEKVPKLKRPCQNCNKEGKGTDVYRHEDKCKHCQLKVIFLDQRESHAITRCEHVSCLNTDMEPGPCTNIGLWPCGPTKFQQKCNNVEFTGQRGNGLEIGWHWHYLADVKYGPQYTWPPESMHQKDRFSLHSPRKDVQWHILKDPPTFKEAFFWVKKNRPTFVPIGEIATAYYKLARTASTTVLTWPTTYKPIPVDNMTGAEIIEMFMDPRPLTKKMKT